MEIAHIIFNFPASQKDEGQEMIKNYYCRIYKILLDLII